MAECAMTVHLAKSPHAAVLVSWCGHEERRTRKPGPPVSRVDGGEIVRAGEYDCAECMRRIEAEARRLHAIIGSGYPSERAATVGLGCGDNSCVIGRRGGMGTNGGCHCDDRAVRRAARAWRAYALALEARVQ